MINFRLLTGLKYQLQRILHSGSALAFQARGAGSIPAIRSNFFRNYINQLFPQIEYLRQIVKKFYFFTTKHSF